MKFFTISIFCIFSAFMGFSQQPQPQPQPQDFSTVEYTLTTLHSKINRFASEEDNLKNNTRFIAILDSVLRIPESFAYSFSNIPIGNVMPPDKSFRILSWSMIHSNGTYENFGLLQVINKETGKIKVFLLKDKSSVIKNQLLQVCSPEIWYGASYYMVCQNKYNGQTFYTLIGWNPNTTFTQKKIIEILKFDSNGVPIFGFPIIELKGKGFQRRMIFEYSSKNTMMVRYDKRKKMIVFDHLAPSDFRYTDIYEFYGPDFSIDGYKFSKGKWRYHSDIDIRNKRDEFTDYLPQRLINLFRKKESNVNQLGL